MATTILRPNGVSIADAWAQVPPSGDHYDKVDEVSADDDTTLNKAESTGISNAYLLENWSLGPKAIDKVEVFTRCKTNNIDIGYAPFLYYPPSTSQGGTPIVFGSADTWTNDTQEISKPGGGGWAYGDIDGLEAGVTSTGTFTRGDIVSVTQLYLIVTYSDLPSGPSDAKQSPGVPNVRQSPGGRSRRQGP